MSYKIEVTSLNSPCNMCSIYRSKIQELQKTIDKQKRIINDLRTDSLTLMNTRKQFEQDRYLFEEEIDKNPKIVYMIDIDYLHTINRLKGYHAGDSLIKKVATYINNIIRNSNATAYRIGGDEFIVIGDLSDKEKLDKLLETPNSTVGSSEWTSGKIDYVLKKIDKQIIQRKKNHINISRNCNNKLKGMLLILIDNIISKFREKFNINNK